MPAARAQFPALLHCRSLVLGENRTVAGETLEQVRAASGEILRRLRAHFPQGRLRKQLKQNPTLQARQRERERKQSDRKQLREALLKAIPEEGWFGRFWKRIFG